MLLGYFKDNKNQISSIFKKEGSETKSKDLKENKSKDIENIYKKSLDSIILEQKEKGVFQTLIDKISPTYFINYMKDNIISLVYYIIESPSIIMNNTKYYINVIGDEIDYYAIGQDKLQVNEQKEEIDSNKDRVESKISSQINNNNSYNIDDMISHSNCEIQELDNICTLINKMVESYIITDEYYYNFFDFLLEQVKHLKKSLILTRNNCIGNFDNIENFNRSNLQYYNITQRYIDELKNTFSHYKNDSFIFNNPLIDIKKLLIVNNNKDIFDNLIINDLCINNFIETIYDYLNKIKNNLQDNNDKIIDVLFHITICVICTINLKMYGLINNPSTYAENLLNKSI